ncbi:IS630 family transposase [Laspinema olomoucense]|uniref:IS630 family transposase n=1 Tax=Laspinema olomoucense TaxID=3231600 RepID=UPI0021BA3FD5|nr:IS630 family transposase [Laspinema sp. D3a]MCT7991971.1 IS630 family transposase [Laspinema sp. D3a]
MEISAQVDTGVSELDELKEFINQTQNIREWKRCKSVILRKTWVSYKEISQLIEVSYSFINRANNLYKNQGLSGLKVKYKGSKSYLSEAQKNQVKAWLLESPAQRNISELERHIMEQYDVVFKSLESYYSLLKESRLTWQKANKENTRKDPEAIKKRTEELVEILEDLKPEIEAGTLVVYALDECHVQGDDVCSYLWADSKDREFIAINNERDRQTYYGALNLINHQFIASPYGTGNGQNTVKFLESIQTLHNQEDCPPKILLIWDGASYHRGEEMKKILTLHNQEKERKDWLIICERFPTYAPEENPVEGIWLQVKNFIRRFHYRCKSFAAVNKLVELFFKYQLFDFPNLKKYNAFVKLI